MTHISKPHSAVLASIAKRQTGVPFRKFAIVTSTGRSHIVQSSQNITITRLLGDIIVEYDDGSMVGIDPRHVAKVKILGPA